jgi:hypothetical protein
LHRTTQVAPAIASCYRLVWLRTSIDLKQYWRR